VFFFLFIGLSTALRCDDFLWSTGGHGVGGEKLFDTSIQTERQTCSSFCLLVCRRRCAAMTFCGALGDMELGEKNFSLHRYRPNDKRVLLFVYWFVDGAALR
jgi:hypothetical protein